MDDVLVTDAQAIEQVYRASADRLWWALLAYTGNRDVASDAVAEAFARALVANDRIRDPAAWVWRVAFRIATKEIRDARRVQPDPGGTYELDEDAASVALALQDLSRRQRAVFVLFYLDDRPAKEIADLLGISPVTVSVHLHRARQRLRSILGDDGE